jgi:phosphoglycolate phosphatase
MSQPLLIFDLDGTISDPAVGIGRSINYALAAFGYPEVNERQVSQYIGPPIDAAFRQIARSATDDEVLGMVARYRERYGEIGYSENVVYAGIPEALEYLASERVLMGVCTSKRVDFAERILERFGLRKHFVVVSGGDVGLTKEDQLRKLLEEGVASHRSTMIGDRTVDMLAARAHKLRSVGVLWGHGSMEELLGVAPDRIFESPVELRELAKPV